LQSLLNYIRLAHACQEKNEKIAEKIFPAKQKLKKKTKNKIAGLSQMKKSAGKIAHERYIIKTALEDYNGLKVEE
jgi:hypothetical protein